MSFFYLTESVSMSCDSDSNFRMCELEESDNRSVSYEDPASSSRRSSTFTPYLHSLTSSISYDSDSSTKDGLRIQLPSLMLQRAPCANRPKHAQCYAPIPNLFDFHIIEQFGRRSYDKSTQILTVGYTRTHQQHVPSDICSIIHQFVQYEANENTTMQFAFYLSQIAQEKSDSNITLNTYFSGKYLIAKLCAYFKYNDKEEIIEICTQLLMDDYIEPDIYGSGICRRNSFNRFYASSRYKLDVFKLNALSNKYRMYKESSTQEKEDSVWNVAL